MYKANIDKIVINTNTRDNMIIVVVELSIVYVIIFIDKNNGNIGTVDSIHSFISSLFAYNAIIVNIKPNIAIAAYAYILSEKNMLESLIQVAIIDADGKRNTTILAYAIPSLPFLTCPILLHFFIYFFNEYLG